MADEKVTLEELRAKLEAFSESTGDELESRRHALQVADYERGIYLREAQRDTESDRLADYHRDVDSLVKFREDSGARDERKVRALERIADAVCKLLDALPGGSRD